MEWMGIASNLIGTNEVPGSKSNPKILGWAKDIGGWIASFFKDDDIPWCGLFVAYVMREAGFEVKLKNPLGARNWAEFGNSTTPRYGAIMVFSREGGGHVGFYVSEDDDTYHILGGNQSNTVNVTKVRKNRFLAARWPEGDNTKTSPIRKKFDGKVSTNER